VPKGAEVLYSVVGKCKFRHGLVRFALVSDEHRTRLTLPLEVAVELYRALGDVIDAARAASVKRLRLREEDG
jgi:hypothetical protein